MLFQEWRSNSQQLCYWEQEERFRNIWVSTLENGNHAFFSKNGLQQYILVPDPSILIRQEEVSIKSSIFLSQNITLRIN